MIYYSYYSSPIGILRIIANEVAIMGLDFVDVKGENLENDWTNQCRNQLDEYFAGTRKVFDLPLQLKGTNFQLKVWKSLTKIEYGKTCSYKHIATMVGNSKASRAVGMANNRNPIAIIIPCHRIIGASGNLVGYGGGLDKKQYLLELEQKYN